MPGQTARCWMLPFHPKGEKAGHKFQTVIPALRSVIPAKAGIHGSQNAVPACIYHGFPPEFSPAEVGPGRRCGSVLPALLPANRRQLPFLGLTLPGGPERPGIPRRSAEPAQAGTHISNRASKTFAGMTALYLFKGSTFNFLAGFCAGMALGKAANAGVEASGSSSSGIGGMEAFSQSQPR